MSDYPPSPLMSTLKSRERGRDIENTSAIEMSVYATDTGRNQRCNADTVLVVRPVHLRQHTRAARARKNQPSRALMTITSRRAARKTEVRRGPRFRHPLQPSSWEPPMQALAKSYYLISH